MEIDGSIAEIASVLTGAKHYRHERQAAHECEYIRLHKLPEFAPENFEIAENALFLRRVLVDARPGLVVIKAEKSHLSVLLLFFEKSLSLLLYHKSNCDTIYIRKYF